ncbi:MAG: PilZ domain-containing protein [bacterium]
MQERRKFCRYPIKLPLHYQTVNPGSSRIKRYGRYMTHDVSLGGICFETREDLEQGLHLSIELHLPKASFSDFVTQEPMHLKGRVAWSRQEQDNQGPYLIGVEFIAIMEGEQKRIEECIDFFLLTEESRLLEGGEQ